MAGLISPLETSQTSQTSQTDQTSETSATSEAGQAPGSPPEPTVQAAGDAGTDDIAVIRALVLKAHPDVVPELVTGSTVAALLSSIEPAQAAFGRLAETIRAGSRPASSVPPAPPAPPVPFVPAGGSAPIPVDPDRLPAAEKIRRGLQARSA